MTDQPEVVVLDHHHDAENSVYRLTLGRPIEVDRMVTDGEGNPVHEAVPLRDGEGGVAKDVDGKEVYLPGAPKFETVTEIVEGENFVFADDDDRWKDKTAEEIAAEQRADVKAQLAERADDAKRAEDARAQRLQLPGAGEAL